jgi:hypothetical protein
MYDLESSDYLAVDATAAVRDGYQSSSLSVGNFVIVQDQE